MASLEYDNIVLIFMKIILTHDIDHLYWKDHYFKDLYTPKYLYRHTKAWLTSQITFKTYKKRLKIHGQMHRIPELLNFHDQHKTKGCFFFGMDNALGLSYQPEDARPWIQEVLKRGHDAGVHGIAYADKKRIQKEYDLFKKLSGLDSFGIRTHYLRMNGYTLEMFSEQRYLFESSIQGILFPFRIGNMLEIPMSLMDSSLVSNSEANQILEVWKDSTRRRLDKAQSLSIPYFVVNYHDIYFNASIFPVAYEWYHWLMEEFGYRKLQFTTFRTAVEEMNRSTPL